MSETTNASEPFTGVWYCCGTANVLPGHAHVYSGPMATYCMWHRPIAVYRPEVDKTFFVYGNADNAPAISFYDHARGSFARPVVLGSNPDGDAHRNPTLLVDAEGFLHVFFGAHSDPTQVVRSTGPYSIADWERRATIDDPRTSYPQPWELRPGEIFVSYRHTPPGWCFRRTTDGAASWGPRQTLIEFAERAIYAVSVAATGPWPRAVHIAWSRLSGGTDEEVRTKHVWARRYNVYYAWSDDGGQTWRRRDGSAYELPIREETAEKVYDCGQHGVWLKDIQLDPHGRPGILFLDADVATYRSAWKVARPEADGWGVHDVAVSDHMYDAGGLVILAEDDWRVYAPTTPSQPQEDGGEIDEWRSADGGRTWRRTAQLTSGSRYSHNQVRVVHNHQAGRGDFRVLWSYGDSVSPPADRTVHLYRYGEALAEPQRMAYAPGS